PIGAYARCLRDALPSSMAELQRVRQDRSDAEVERATNKSATSIVLSGEMPLGRVNALGSQLLYNGDYRSLEQDMQALMAVKADEDRKSTRLNSSHVESS